MRNNLATAVRELVSPSMRYQFGEWVNWLREQMNRVCLWKWEIAKLPQPASGQHDIVYIGRKSQRDLARALLLGNRDIETNAQHTGSPDRRAVISELPLPGSLCVPSMLSSIVPLDRPIEEITANFHSQLRRDLHKHRTKYRLQQALDDGEIEQADREMLRPYAIARHGAVANQIELDEVKRLAQKYGRLDLLLFGDEVVGCQQGFGFAREGKRYWSTNRCGYPESVFSDHKRLRDFNAFNIHLAMEWALENGFDYYDIGLSLGRPGDGLLEWKRRRGGELDTLGNSLYFHLCLPRAGAAQFLWDAPVFAVEHGKLTLHLGLPLGLGDEEVVNRYREMAFGGLFRVYLHSVTPPAEHISEMLRGLYAQQKSPPVVEVIAST
jgi:hypothetical protein